MKRKTWHLILLSGLSVLLVGLVVACMPPKEQAEKKPAKFEISLLTVRPHAVMVGDSATVTATVINSGDIAGAYEASLMIDGEEIDRKVAWVDSGVPKEVSFQVTRTTAGSYELMVGNAKAKFTVCDWAPQTIKYDTTEYEQITGYGTCTWAEGWGHIVHFTPLAPPFKIQKISIQAFTQVKNFPDLSKRMFTVRIWNENKTTQLWSDNFPWSLFIGGGWKDIDVPNIIADGDFHVEVITNSDAPPSANRMYICYEESKDESRSGISYMGAVYKTELYAAKDKRWLIRVNGQGPPETCIPENYVTEVREEATSDSEEQLTISPSKLVYEDDFSNSASGWTQASDKEGESYYKDGEFHGVVKMWDWSGWQYNRNAGRFKDFIIEEDIRLVSGPMSSAYGLIFRCQDDDNFYRFLIASNGSYLIGTRLDGKWTILQSSMPSPYINQGNSTNHLKVICKGNQIEAQVNGHHLTTVVDDSFADGYVGGI